jgi:hypothetical protein
LDGARGASLYLVALSVRWRFGWLIRDRDPHPALREGEVGR